MAEPVNKKNKKIVLEDGSVYEGYGFGADSERVCEIRNPDCDGGGIPPRLQFRFGRFPHRHA